MARIYKNEDGKYCVWSLQSDCEKVAFESELIGNDLKSAILNGDVEIYLSGWSFGEVIEDLLESGILPNEIEQSDIDNIGKPDFFIVAEFKNAVTWAHVSGVAKTFIKSEMSFNSGSWVDSEDGMKGKTEGSFQLKRNNTSLETAKADYENNKNDWKAYELKYNSAFRKNDIIYL